MRPIYLMAFVLFSATVPFSVNSQSIGLSKEFSLGSPFSEPDGRSEVVRINNSDFITLAKSKGNQSGKSDFVMERYDGQLNVVWKKELSAENSEDYKDLYYNGKELVLLSVIHLESEKKTKMMGYGFDVKDGTQLWVKELESYQVGDWEIHPHKGRVKETFIDLVCEHVNQDFVTPFEYKHNIHFSPDQSKFISYVYNYGEQNLTASICIYDNSCNLLKKGKIAIDNDYVNYGFFIDNDTKVYILNAGNSGKTNLIQFDLETKDFTILELPFSNYKKDDFHAKIAANGIIYLGNSEVKDGKIYGAMLSRFNFNTKEVEFSNFVPFDTEFKSKIAADRKNNKLMKGEEDWLDFDLTHFEFRDNQEVLLAFEKRALHGDGYPHIGKDAFDKSHKGEISGHVQAETVILVSFNKEGDLKWKNYHLKNQVYPANDGLNTISYVLHSDKKDEIKMVYASSDNLDGSLHKINVLTINYADGTLVKTNTLPNPDKLTIVKDYTLFLDDSYLLVIGKKGLLGKSSMMVKYKYQ